MKTHVLFDDEGEILALAHPNPKTGSEPFAEGGGFLSGTGQHTEILEIPEGLEGLKPHALHAALRVERKAGTTRLVTKARVSPSKHE